MAMVAVAVGYCLGSRDGVSLLPLSAACLGILCMAVACSLLNQWLEADSDARMHRTSDRPVPAGRIRPADVLTVGLVFASLGTVWLWLQVNLLTAMLGAITLGLYVCAYTPMKRVSSFCTVIGAVSGALPPVLGWTAAGGALDGGAMALFLLLFVWQFPHFLAIATIHRKDYESAGLKMLPMISGRSCAGLVSVAYACALIPISLLIRDQGLVGAAYPLVAITGGIVYLISSFRFLLDGSVQKARELLLCSIIYLPVVLLTMTWDHYRLLS